MRILLYRDSVRLSKISSRESSGLQSTPPFGADGSVVHANYVQQHVLRGKRSRPLKTSVQYTPQLEVGRLMSGRSACGVWERRTAILSRFPYIAGNSTLHDHRSG